MKMKKIAAVLTALSVLSGCSGNTVTNETVTTTGTTTEAVTTAAEATTGTKKTALAPAVWATPSETTTPEEEIIPLELETLSHREYLGNNDRLTENTVIAVLVNNLGYISSLGDNLRSDSVEFVFYDDYSTLEEPYPSSTIVKTWGYYPSMVSKMFEDENRAYVFGKYNCNDMTGCEPEEMYSKVDGGTPVMVYCTLKLKEPEVLKEYNGEILWDYLECVILVGYSENNVMVWSPLLDKNMTYPRADFEAVFKKMGSMALTIEKK